MGFKVLESPRFVSYQYLLKWISISLLSGISGVLILRSFVFLSSYILQWIEKAPVPIIVWPIAGALFTGGIIYRIEIGSAGEGIPAYIYNLNQNKNDFPFKSTFFKYFAALITLSTFGNGGIIGPLGRVSAGLSSSIIKQFNRRFPEKIIEERRIAAICGMAAIVGAVFHSSIGAGIFAVEIIQRRSLHYSDIFPAILASSTAVFVSKAAGWDSFYKIEIVQNFMDFEKIGWLVLFSIGVGFTGGLFTLIYKGSVKLFKRNQGRIVLKVTLGSLFAFLIAYLINPELIGTSRNLFQAAMSGDIELITGNLSNLPATPLMILIIILIKITSNCITVGSGMSAGFTGPSVLTGMLLGVSATTFLGLEPGSATSYAFMAAGFSGMLASSMNVPLAGAIIAIEIFGLHYSFPAAFSAIIGFQIMRNSTIYDYAINFKKSEKNSPHQTKKEPV